MSHPPSPSASTLLYSQKTKYSRRMRFIIPRHHLKFRQDSCWNIPSYPNLYAKRESHISYGISHMDRWLSTTMKFSDDVQVTKLLYGEWRSSYKIIIWWMTFKSQPLIDLTGTSLHQQKLFTANVFQFRSTIISCHNEWIYCIQRWIQCTYLQRIWICSLCRILDLSFLNRP